jgi:hypothetical protein
LCSAAKNDAIAKFAIYDCIFGTLLEIGARVDQGLALFLERHVTCPIVAAASHDAAQHAGFGVDRSARKISARKCGKKVARLTTIGL